jgi:hypothetical protein
MLGQTQCANLNQAYPTQFANVNQAYQQQLPS